MEENVRTRQLIIMVLIVLSREDHAVVWSDGKKLLWLGWAAGLAGGNIPVVIRPASRQTQPADLQVSI